MNIVLVSPHRDDAAFSLGLSIEHWAAAGHTVTVLNCFTRSEFAPYSDAPSLHQNDRASFVSAVRRREDEAWSKLLRGRVRLHDLDLLDAPIRLACNLDELFTLDIRPGDRAVARVQGAISKALLRGGQSGVALLLPLSIGGHIDHRVVRQAGQLALAACAVPTAFYEDLPYSANLEDREAIRNMASEIGLDLQPVFSQKPREEVDAAVEQKWRMAECYDSQITGEAAKQIAAFCTQYAGRERLWANPLWQASALTAQE